MHKGLNKWGVEASTDGSLRLGTQNQETNQYGEDFQQLKCKGTFALVGTQILQKTLNDIHKLPYMYIVHVPCFVFNHSLVPLM